MKRSASSTIGTQRNGELSSKSSTCLSEVVWVGLIQAFVLQKLQPATRRIQARKDLIKQFLTRDDPIHGLRLAGIEGKRRNAVVRSKNCFLSTGISLVCMR